MYSTQVYLYQQIARILLIDTGDTEAFSYRWNPVYAKPLTINLGVDNVILFQFVNQEQKPVDITGGTMIFRLLNQAGTKVLLEQSLAILNAPSGRAKVTIPAIDMVGLRAQPVSYSLTFSNSTLIQPVFTDAASNARAPGNLVDSVQPIFVPSAPLTIPTTNLSSQDALGATSLNDFPGWNAYWSGSPNGTNSYNGWLNTEYYSSFISPRGPVTTIQMDLVGYTGTIKAQAAENYESIWYNVTESTTYYNETRTIYMNILGWHPLLRLCFNNSVFSSPEYPGYPALAYATCSQGEVQSISVTQPGRGYLAKPLIAIIGDGAGAVADAQIGGNGEVIGITVTNPGSGYWPVPNNGGNPNAVPYPINPNQTGALVLITTGYVTNLSYR